MAQGSIAEDVSNEMDEKKKGKKVYGFMKKKKAKKKGSKYDDMPKKKKV